MFVYKIVMILCCILLYAMRNNKNKVTPLAVVFGLIWLMISLQQGWGGDFDYYFHHFDQIKGDSFFNLVVDDSHGEIGYKLFMSIMPTFQTGFAIAMFIWCFSLAFFFYHFIPQKWWFFALLFVFWDRPILMGMVASFARMAIANAFLFFAMYLVKIKKNKYGVLLLIPALFFHKSVLFLLALLFMPDKPMKGLSKSVVLLLFLLVAFSWAAPNLFVGYTQDIITEVDALSQYTTYFDDAQSFQMRGLSLIVISYWIFLIIKLGLRKDLTSVEYFLLYCALIRIAFNLLPDLGMSVRFYYYVDTYFFAGMMCVMNRLPKGNPHRYGLALTLIVMFWFLGFRKFSSDPFFLENWNFYNFIF